MQSEEKYRLLVSKLPAVVFKGYADWAVDFFDDKIEALIGYSKADFDSRRLKWSEVIRSEDFSSAKEAFIQALRTNQSYVREYRIQAKDGGIIWIQEKGQIVRIKTAGSITSAGCFSILPSGKSLKKNVSCSAKWNR